MSSCEQRRRGRRRGRRRRRPRSVELGGVGRGQLGREQRGLPALRVPPEQQVVARAGLGERCAAARARRARCCPRCSPMQVARTARRRPCPGSRSRRRRTRRAAASWQPLDEVERARCRSTGRSAATEPVVGWAHDTIGRPPVGRRAGGRDHGAAHRDVVAVQVAREVHHTPGDRAGGRGQESLRPR